MQNLTNAQKYIGYQSVEESLKKDRRYGLLSRYLESVNRFLLLAHQTRDPVSVFKVQPTGQVVPVFRKTWLSRCLPGLTKSDTLEEIAENWLEATGWASPSSYFRASRFTLADLEALSLMPTRHQLTYLGKDLEKATEGLQLPNWSRVLVSANGKTVTVAAEYVGWLIESQREYIFRDLESHVDEDDSDELDQLEDQDEDEDAE